MASIPPTVSNPTWQEVSETAQEHRDASIARVEPTVPDVPNELPLDVIKLPQELLSKDEVDITQSLTEDLVPSIASGQLSSTTVTKAFLRRAGLAQRLVGLMYCLLWKRT